MPEGSIQQAVQNQQSLLTQGQNLKQVLPGLGCRLATLFLCGSKRRQFFFNLIGRGALVTEEPAEFTPDPIDGVCGLHAGAGELGLRMHPIVHRFDPGFDNRPLLI